MENSEDLGFIKSKVRLLGRRKIIMVKVYSPPRNDENPEESTSLRGGNKIPANLINLVPTKQSNTTLTK
jgi:hypothetical protein